MPEKLRFADNTEFDLAPNGIGRETTDKKKSFKFISELDYMAITAIVSNPDNFAMIYTIGNDGNIQNTYVECVAFKGLGIEKDVMISDTEKADVYTVTYSVDGVIKQLHEAQGKNKELEEKLTVIDGAFWDILINFIPNIPMN